ncbi:MAG: hypothetical protein JNM36_09605 [Chitinophagales bacterium]|nr:hypothetical protein [Chitinophagales bacterium]
MKATITSIELKGPLKFFALSSTALSIIKQLKATNCKDFKKKGIWTKHYTMTLWNNESELKEFAKSGAHLDAMKKRNFLFGAAIINFVPLRQKKV